MRHLHEAKPAVLAIGDVAPRQLHLELHRVVLRAEEHRLLPEERALLAVVEDALDEPRGLLGLVPAGHDGGPPSALALGPQVLVAALGGLGDDRVGRGEDRRARPVVARQGDDLGVLEALLEVEDVAHGGRPEAVDRLRVVTHARHARAVRPQQRDDVGLDRVGVLELVDEHVVEALSHALAGSGVGQKGVPEQQKVVVVEDLLGFLDIGVGAEEIGEPFLGVLAPRERRLQHLGQGGGGVHAA